MATEILSASEPDVELTTQPVQSEQIKSDSECLVTNKISYNTFEEPEEVKETGQTNVTNDKVRCICGTLMIEGIIKQGSPPCANTKCPSGGKATSESGSCFYCPSGSQPTEHPQGFYYCHHCASAVAKSGFKTSNNAVEAFQASTSTVSRCTQIRLITWKNYKTQVVRRKCSFCCKMCCPLTFILIMGIVGLLRPFFTYYVNCAQGEGAATCQDIYIAPEQHNRWNQYSATTYSPDSFIPSLLCPEEWECPDEGDNSECYPVGIHNPPHYIGIVYDEDSADSVHIAAVMDIIGANSGEGEEYIYNDTVGFLCDEFAADVSMMNWTDGSALKWFGNEGALEEYIRSDGYGQSGYNFENDARNGALRPIAAAIVFKSVSDDGKVWDYALRFNASNVPETFNDNQLNIVDRVNKDGNQLSGQSVARYEQSGFIELQSMVDSAITQYIAVEVNEYAVFNATYLDFKKGYFIFPFTSYKIDLYWTFMVMPFIIFATIMFVYPVIQIISVLVTEKANKIKEGMKMMGATTSIYWTSMYLWFTIEFTLICIIIVLIGYLMNVFLYSNGLIMLLWFWLFCMSQMAWSTLISVFFDNPKTATIVGFVLYFVLIGLSVTMGNATATQKQLYCLLATPCFMQSLSVVVQYESALTGIQWNNLQEHVAQFSMGTCLTMLFIDIILYSLLTLYLDNVWPTRFGQTKSPFFCLSPSYWRCGKNKPSDATYSSIAGQNKLTKLAANMESYEDVATSDNLKNKEPMIYVRNLSKTFGSVLGRSRVLAVRGVSLDIYAGEVFCLLGHNGAGKTTVISMLSGLLSTTDGAAYINGHDINLNMDSIRKFLGVCPQHDVLWDLLTAEEHLRFFARLKGVASDKINYEINRMINLFNMLDSGIWGKYPPNMSGGEKRRLSLAISLIGGSSIVFLDEPTSGMDPENRRKVWDIIEQEKKNRLIILTTHYMDEADTLGDRIAIMSSGQIKCCGSALYLKRLYGVGYSFTVSLKSGTNLEEEKDASLKGEIDDILSDINGMETVSVAASEILYKLPFEGSGEFANVFQKLDQNKQSLKIETFGVSVTTLEEVFLKIGNHDTKTNDMNDKIASSDQDAEQEEKYAYDTVGDLKFEQAEFQLENSNALWILMIHIYAILYKRFWWSIRDIKGIICQIVLPVVLIGLLFGLTEEIQISQQELHLAPSQFVDEYTDSVIVPIGKLAEDYTINVSNLYYTDPDYNWPRFYHENMQSTFGHNQTFSIGTNASTDISCLGYNANSVQFYSDSPPNCTASLQEEIYHHSSRRSTPYFGFYFSPHINTHEWESNNEVLFGVNASAYHSLPISANVWSNWVLRNVYDSEHAAQINVYSYPFPKTKQEEQVQTAQSGMQTAINLLIAFTLIPASSIYFVVNEKIIGTKHQQFVSGISIPSYWIGTYVSDILLGVPASTLVVVLVYIFDVDEFKNAAAMPLFLSLLLFVSSSIAAGYLLHFWFKSPGKAQFITILFNILLGVIFTIVTSVLDSIGDESTDQTSEDIKTVVRILPIFLLSENILRIISKPFENPTKSYWHYKVTQRNINYMILESVGYFLLVILIEYARSFPSLLAKLGFVVDQPRKYIRLDEDVLAEQERIKQAVDPVTGNFISGILDDTVVLCGLRKVYKGENKFSPYKPAVRDMSFGVKQGEVFGFLGVNGAGKTSTLQLLTGENYPSDGIGFINGKSIVNQQLAIRRNIGFCPQNDAIFDLLTAYEHLKFYALIKGLNGAELHKQIGVLLSALTLNKYSKRTAHTYSGGNKRKLCVAQAMIGNPPVIFLDEPSTGMDPVSRRFMWKFINQTMAGRAVVITTHSMEECEALCHRVGIMVAGQLSCIGSPQYLKSKFGKGYQLDITLQNIDNSIDSDTNIIHNLLEEFNKTFPTTILQQNGNKILLEIRQYDIDDNSVGGGDTKLAALGQMFEFVENVKAKYNILSYALSQTSLEQVFLKMAKAKGELEQEHDTTTEQRELLKIIKRETKNELVQRIAILNRDHLEQILENEIKNGSQYIVKALMNNDQ